MNLPFPENELPLACLQSIASKEAADTDLRPLLHHVNWTRLLWLGRQQGVLLAVYTALKKPCFTGLCPEAILAQLRAFHEVNQLRSIARAREVCLLQDIFDQNAVPTILVD